MARTIILGLLIITGTYASADKFESQLDLNRKAHAAFLKADANLNAVYKQVRATLDDEGKLKLRDAQRAWIKFRDADCAWAADAYRGGSIMPMIYALHAEQMTKARTATLTARLNDDK